MNKTAAIKCRMPHNLQSAFCFTVILVQLLAPSCARTNKKFYSLFNKLA